MARFEVEHRIASVVVVDNDIDCPIKKVKLEIEGVFDRYFGWKIFQKDVDICERFVELLNYETHMSNHKGYIRCQNDVISRFSGEK